MSQAKDMRAPKWVLRTFQKYGWADFCLNCGIFVITPGSHCWGLYKDHVVVRKVGK